MVKMPLTTTSRKELTTKRRVRGKPLLELIEVMIVSSVLVGLILLATQSTTTIQSADGLLLSSSSSFSSALSFVQRPIIQSVVSSSRAIVGVDDRKSRGRIIHPTSSLFESSSGSGGGGFGNDNRRIPKVVNDNTTLKQQSSSSSQSSTIELFEYQELRAQLTTMIQQNILYQTLTYEKSIELSNYVRTVIRELDSPIDFTGRSRGSSSMGTAYFVAGLENKSWRMIFTTTTACVSDDNKGSSNRISSSNNSSSSKYDIELPYGSSIVLRIGSFMGTQGSLDYVIKWNNSNNSNNNNKQRNNPLMWGLGLKELVAKSTCSIDIGSINPGLLTHQYQDIKTNIFGLTNVPVGFFGLLKGRINYIDTVWFDGERWITRDYSTNGNVIYSVYVNV